MQNYTSKNTSVNGRCNKLPRLYNTITFPKGGRVVDYGCGNITTLLENKAIADECIWYGYDKYWGDEERNNDTLRELNNHVELSVCCNVLNVIDDDEEIKNIIETLINNSDETIIQIYEGNGSGVGKVTKEDQYQRNCKVEWYKDFISKLGYKVNVKNKLLYCSK